MADSPRLRYQRMSEAVATLTELAAEPDLARLAGVLAGDEVVLARMRAAAVVLGTADVPGGLPGLDDLPECTEGGLLNGAIGWQRYARGPVDDLARACATDMARGLLRLWAARRRPPAGDPLARRIRLRQARLALLGRVRTRCAALRTELRDDAASLTRRGTRGFADHVCRRVATVAGELSDEVDWELPESGDAHLPDPVLPPAPRRGGSEMRLTGLLGVVFGAGAALTLMRMLSPVATGWAGTAVVVSAAAGLAMGGWLVAARRLLAHRAALDRWVAEVSAAVRAALEERIALRALATEAAEARRGSPAGLTVDYRPPSGRS